MIDPDRHQGGLQPVLVAQPPLELGGLGVGRPVAGRGIAGVTQGLAPGFAAGPGLGVAGHLGGGGGLAAGPGLLFFRGGLFAAGHRQVSFAQKWYSAAVRAPAGFGAVPLVSAVEEVAAWIGADALMIVAGW